MYGGKVDKPIAFEEMLVLSSYMSKASQVCCEKNAEMIVLYAFILRFPYPWPKRE